MHSCALGELLKTFGDFAEPSDIGLLADFVLGPLPFKPLVNAFGAMARTVRRHHQSAEADAFFRDKLNALQRRGVSLANIHNTSVDIRALLFSWIELMVARLCHEGDLAINIAREYPTLKLRTAKAIEHAQRALMKREMSEGRRKEVAARVETWMLALSVPQRFVQKRPYTPSPIYGDCPVC